MREILFRGFHKEENGKETIYIDGQPIKGKWVYGSLVSYPNNVYEIWNIQMGRCCLSTEHFKVIPETIGLGTILKNGLKIFEGDTYHHGDNNITYTVVWHDSGLIGKQNKSSSYVGLEAWADRIQIIGTIFDDKEVK